MICNQINQRVPKANLWIINYCILEMKADNKPAISLPVYFKSVKIENMFFDKKKKKKERKKERKKNQVSDGGSRTPGFPFFTRGREVELEYQTMST